MPGLLGALWLLGLLAAAPALPEARGAAGRLRNALALGIAIPFALGYVQLLFPAACWIALAACIVVARRRRGESPVASRGSATVPYLSIACVALIAWPPLMRPLLDGDSVTYHLPNAAAWVHAHGLWTTDPRYWWYPPASELFASALYAVAGPFVVGWSGVGPLLLIAFRIVAWARQRGASPLLSDALAAATVTAWPIALQAGSLQNDVWLAAFFLELLWAARSGGAAAIVASAMTALLKPYGVLFAFFAAALRRARGAVWAAFGGAFALWAAHDAILWRTALVAPASTSYGDTWNSTIAAHGWPALVLLGHVMTYASPFAALMLVAALFAPVLSRGDRALGYAALGALLFYLVMPLAYAGPGPQLATGGSLRFAAPAIAPAALALVPLLERGRILAIGLLIASALFGAVQSVLLYRADLPTFSAIGVALLAAGAVALAVRRGWVWPIAAGTAAAVMASALLAARMPVAYYTDALRVNGRTTGLYGWLAHARPNAIGATGLRLGTVNVLSPRTRALDLPDGAPCAVARMQRVLLVAIAESDRSARFNAARLNAARACGKRLYDDGLAVVTLP